MMSSPGGGGGVLDKDDESCSVVPPASLTYDVEHADTPITSPRPSGQSGRTMCLDSRMCVVSELD